MATKKTKISTTHIQKVSELDVKTKQTLTAKTTNYMADLLKTTNLRTWKQADLAYNPVLRQIPLGLITLPKYQEIRALRDLPHVRQIYAEFDPLRFQPILVNYSSKTKLLHVVDGHHRLEVAHIMGMKHIMAFIINVSHDTEHMLFADQHETTKNLSPLASYSAHIGVMNPDSHGDIVKAHKMIEEALLKYKLAMGNKSNIGVVTPKAMDRIILGGNKGSQKLVTNAQHRLDWVLSAMTESGFAFTQEGSTSHVFIGAIACYIEANKRKQYTMEEWRQAFITTLQDLSTGENLKLYVASLDASKITLSNGKTTVDKYQRALYGHVLKNMMINQLP